MFTGIVRELGEVEALEGDEAGVRLRVRAPETAARSGPGDSIAVNGVCLTATQVVDGELSFDVVRETLGRSTLGRLRQSAGVNVEPALHAGDPLGGHIVQGHVDGVGRVISLEPEGDGKRLVIRVPGKLAHLCVEKGSIAVEGVSLTIADVEGERVSIALVPHTLGATTLGGLRPGDEVNVEADVIAKHVERLLEARGRSQ